MALRPAFIRKGRYLRSEHMAAGRANEIVDITSIYLDSRLRDSRIRDLVLTIEKASPDGDRGLRSSRNGITSIHA